MLEEGLRGSEKNQSSLTLLGLEVSVLWFQSEMLPTGSCAGTLGLQLAMVLFCEVVESFGHRA